MIGVMECIAAALTRLVCLCFFLLSLFILGFVALVFWGKGRAKTLEHLYNIARFFYLLFKA